MSHPESAGRFGLHTSMSCTDYHRVVEHLDSLGVGISMQEYSEQTFGSWFVVTSTSPARRLVWEGKERWYVVEEETTQHFNGLPVWHELWISRGSKVRSLDAALDALLNFSA